MKNIFTSLICVLLLFLSCSKEESNNNNSVNNSDLAIGDFYEGGIVFYLDLSANHGLICDVKNLQDTYWGCRGTNISGADATEIGYGFQNTNHIIAACSSSNGTSNAAELCYNSNAQGYTDWYLPSYDELKKMYSNKYQIESANGVSPFGMGEFWSSSEQGPGEIGMYSAYSVNFDNGDDSVYNEKDETQKVRAIRSF